MERERRMKREKMQMDERDKEMSGKNLNFIGCYSVIT